MNQLLDLLQAAAPYLVMAISVALALVTAGHAVLYRRDARTAIAWVGLIWLVPLLGSVLYVLFGINRVRRRARSLRSEHDPRQVPVRDEAHCGPRGMSYLTGASHLEPLVQLMDRVVDLPLLLGNRVDLLEGGDAAYGAMLAAIDGARRSVALTSYIFDGDRAGRRFVEALARAVGRGVQVRVLVDGVGARYSRPPVTRLLRRAGVPAALFLKPLVPWRLPYMNLRTHRKLLVLDGRVAFAGGMNIREGTMRQLDPPPGHPICDVHARLEGPLVTQLQQTFVEDWRFVTGEALVGDRWLPLLSACGEVMARAVPDGPDEDFDELRLTLLGMLAVARERVRITTPYFVPDPALITALNVAALRGVQVDIVVPARNNLRLVQWASSASLLQVLRRGCRVWLSPPPFDHSKLVVADGVWTLLGSGNWDARSLRLNFELNVECYDRDLATAAEQLVEARIAAAEELTAQALEARPLAVRLRDGVARLWSPYL